MNDRSRYQRILFAEPIPGASIYHAGTADDVFIIDVNLFCGDIVAAVRKWLQDVGTTQKFRDNYDKFMRRYPNGLPPYFVGRPVVS